MQQSYNFAWTRSFYPFLSQITRSRVGGYTDMIPIPQTDGSPTKFSLQDENGTAVTFFNYLPPLRVAIEGCMDYINRVFAPVWKMAPVNLNYNPIISSVDHPVDINGNALPPYGALKVGLAEVVKGFQLQNGYNTGYGANFNSKTYVIFMHTSEYIKTTTNGIPAFPLYNVNYDPAIKGGLLGYHDPDRGSGTHRYIIIFYDRHTRLLAPGRSLTNTLTHEMCEDLCDNNILNFCSFPKFQGNLQTTTAGTPQTFSPRIVEVCDACQSNIVSYRSPFTYPEITGVTSVFILYMTDFLFPQFYNYYSEVGVGANGLGGLYNGPYSLTDFIVFYINQNFPNNTLPTPSKITVSLPAIPNGNNLIDRPYQGEFNQNNGFPPQYN